MAILQADFCRRCARLWKISLLVPDLVTALVERGARDESSHRTISPQAAVDRDGAIADELLAGTYAGPAIRVWQNSRALVVPRAFRNRAGFAEASAHCDCPVLLRLSGGSAVMHGPHILNVTRFSTMPRTSPVSIASAFADLGKVLCDALTDCGIAASLADVPGAHCPGRYSLQLAGRKLAGTAGFMREREDKRVIVAHASMTLSIHPDDLNCIEKFENALGFKARYDRSAHTSLQGEYRKCISLSRSCPPLQSQRAI